MTPLENLRRLVADQELRRATAESNVLAHGQRLGEIEARCQVIHEARGLCVEAGRIAREKTVSQVEAVVTAALRAVFQDKTMRFVVEFCERRGAIEADYLVEWEQDGVVLRRSPMKAKGGSLKDVISTALLLILLVRFRPARRKLLWLDEPGKWIARENLTRYARWLRTLAHEFGIQLILISHAPELQEAGDKIVDLRPGKGGVRWKTSLPARSSVGYGTEIPA